MLGKMAFFFRYILIIFILHEWILVDLNVLKFFYRLPMSLMKWFVFDSVLVVVGAQVCLPPTIHNHLLARVPQQRPNQSQPIFAGSDLALRVGPLNQSSVDGNAFDDVILLLIQFLTVFSYIFDFDVWLCYI